MRGQSGASLIGVLVTLVAWGLLLLVLMKVAPLYIDDYFVAGAFRDLQDANIRELDNGAIRNALGKQFTVNNIRDLDPAQAQVVREKARTLVKLTYEKRVAVVHNLDVVATFTHVYDSAQPQ